MISKDEFARRFTEIYENAKYSDRVNKKWTAMMLPEHTTQLRQDAANYG